MSLQEYKDLLLSEANLGNDRLGNDLATLRTKIKIMEKAWKEAVSLRKNKEVVEVHILPGGINELIFDYELEVVYEDPIALAPKLKYWKFQGEERNESGKPKDHFASFTYKGSF